MKKTSKIFGAVAVSAALALGTAVPAFADDLVASVDPGTDSEQLFATEVSGGTYSATNATTVDVLYKARQINASVPIKATIVAAGTSSKADAIMAPNKEAYKITNNSESVDIKVTGIKSENTSGAAWQLGTITSGSPATTAGLLDLTIVGYSDGTTAGDTIDLSSNNSGGDKPKGALNTSVAANWTATAQKEILLEIAGKSLPTATQAATSTDNGAVKSEAVFKVTYTLSIAD